MLRGSYAAATGMISQYRKIDVIGNNISNSETPGFKEDDLHLKSFKDQLLYNMNTGAAVGNVSAGVASDEVVTSLDQGTFTQTGLSTDLAIASDGFFAVQGAGGTEYTRDGNFTIDAGGYLALSTGQRLLGENGPIRVVGQDFTVSSDGAVTVNGAQAGKIALYGAPNAQAAEKQADGLFTITGATAVNGNIKQGYIENSNADIISNMSKLMQSSRSFQSCQQAYKVSDQSDELAVSQAGKLS